MCSGVNARSMRQMEIGGRFLFAGAAAALLSSLVFMRTAHAGNNERSFIICVRESVVCYIFVYSEKYLRGL